MNESSIRYRGWLIAVGASLAIFASFGIRSAFSTIIDPLEQKFLGSRADISAIGALNLLLYGLAQPFVGYAVDRFGGRLILAASVLFLGVGIVVTGLATEIWHVYIAYGVLVAIGIALATPVSVSATVSPWFEQRRGLAISVANSGSPLGQLILVPVSMWLVLSYGLASGYLMLGIGLTVITFPLVLWLVRAPGEADSGSISAARSASPADASAQLSANSALKTGVFWILAIGMLICGYSSAGVVITHLVPHSLCIGVAPMAGAAALALVGGTNFLGVMSTGYLTDRIGRVGPLATLFLIRGVSHLMIYFAGDETALLIAAAIYGFTHSATMSTTAALIADYFGKRNVGLLYGYMLLGHQVAAAAGAYFGGLAFDRSGNYTFAFESAAFLSFGAAVTALLLYRKPVLAYPRAA